MAKLKNLEDLFLHQLRDIYSAENQIIKALPKMINNASDSKLKNAFKNHLEETNHQVRRLDEIGKELGVKLTGETCKGMKGLVDEAESFMSEGAEKNIRDAGLIADAQRIEHYEISAYGSLIEFAKALGRNDLAKKLEQTLQEEIKADKKLNQLVIDAISIIPEVKPKPVLK